MLIISSTHMYVKGRGGGRGRADKGSRRDKGRLELK